MKTYGVYHGGRNYSTYWTNQDVEEFDSLQSARDTFESRNDFDPHFPCTDESAEMQLFLIDPRSENSKPTDAFCDIYPDRLLTIGPRGGTVMMPA